MSTIAFAIAPGLLSTPPQQLYDVSKSPHFRSCPNFRQSKAEVNHYRKSAIANAEPPVVRQTIFLFAVLPREEDQGYMRRLVRGMVANAFVTVEGAVREAVEKL